MGLINGINMEFFNKVMHNLKAKNIGVVDTKGTVTGTPGKETNVQAMFDTLTLSGGTGSAVEEISISETEPSDPNIKLWAKQDALEEGEDVDIIPFVKDNEVSEENTWSSQKILQEIQAAKSEMAAILQANQSNSGNS